MKLLSNSLKTIIPIHQQPVIMALKSVKNLKGIVENVIMDMKIILNQVSITKMVFRTLKKILLVYHWTLRKLKYTISQ